MFYILSRHLTIGGVGFGKQCRRVGHEFESLTTLKLEKEAIKKSMPPVRVEVFLANLDH